MTWQLIGGGLLFAFLLYVIFASLDSAEVPDLIIVRSDHVGGHRTVKRLGQVTTRGHYTAISVKEDLSRKAAKRGANALLNYTWHRSRKKGAFGQWADEFWGEAEAAILEKQS